MSSAEIGTTSFARSAAGRQQGYLFSPLVDFFCLGGSSLFVLPLLLLVPTEQYRASLAFVMLLLANVINHPHFAHSYQLFYRNFRSKVLGHEHNPVLRARYIFAGVIVPILLAAFFAISLLKSDTKLLGYAGNAMVFFVGWHYVKQGYGMLMVDAALKRRFFTQGDKKILLINSYVVWIASWLTANAQLATRELWGLTYYSIPVPQELLIACNAGVAVAGAATIWMFARRWRENGGTLPFNGVVAYVATLYMWMLFVRVDPLWLLVTPALHSLQYLVVVWRYESNYQKDQPGAMGQPNLTIFRAWLGKMHRLRLLAFSLAGLILGFVGFWAAPIALQQLVPHDREIFGATLFLFVFWIFINVHHYFLDNVMWRRDNPDVRRYLFG
jgi:hypothetical protein